MANRGMTEFRANGTDYTVNDPNVANEFNTSVTYNIGEYCYRQGNLYRFVAAHSAGSWNSSHVEQVKLGADAYRGAAMQNGMNVSAVENINAASLWEGGAISTSTGANAANSARVRTAGFLPTNARTLTVPSSTRGFYILAYSVYGNYIGAYKSDGTFVTDGSENGYSSFNIGELLEAHPQYRFRISVYPKDSSSVTMSEVVNWTITNILFEMNSQIQLNNTQLNVSKADNINLASMWESGLINTATGVNAADSSRIRTGCYLPTNAKRILIPATRGFYILAYDMSGTYIGAYKSDGTFVKNGTESGYNTEFDLGNLQQKYPGYRFKISVYKRSGTDITVAEAADYEITNGLIDGETVNIRLVQYNIGKFNWGSSGGLSTDVATKIANYKEFFAKYNADFVTLQEYVQYIDSGESYAADATLFDPIFLAKSYQEKETAIMSQYGLWNTQFSYIHTSGDYSAWCIYGSANVRGKTIAIVSAVLNVESDQASKIRALTKLTEQLVAAYDTVIIGVDTNVQSQNEADAIKAFMTTEGYVSGNWRYQGYVETYNLGISMYHCIDNVFVKGNARIVNFEAPDVYSDLSSDHFPVVCDIRVAL